MTKFNERSNVFHVPVESRKDVTRNDAGGIAFKADPKMKLLLKLMTMMVSEDGYYKSGAQIDNDFKAVANEVMRIDPASVPKFWTYARKVMNIRSASTMLMGEFALSPYKNKVYNSRKWIADSMIRVDDMTELASYVSRENESRHIYKGKLPWVVKKGIAKAFDKFDEYQFAKYDRDGNFTIRDLIRLCRPKPKDMEQDLLYYKVRNRELSTPLTWETELSRNGNNAASWEKLIWSGKLPYMALLRNLRNIIGSGVTSVAIDQVVNMLTDPNEVRNSKQFPYRFYSAYRELEKTNLYSPDPVDNTFAKLDNKHGEIYRTRILDAVQDAMKISVDNIPPILGTTFITADNSASMGTPISSKSSISCCNVAMLFGSMIHAKTHDSIISVFGTEFAIVPLSKHSSILDNMKKMENTKVGGNTYAYKPIKYLLDGNIKVDRIVLLSDMQCYDNVDYGNPFRSDFGEERSFYKYLMEYKRKVNRNVFVYTINLANSGEMQIPQDEPNVCKLSGYSDKILSFIPMFEKNRQSMIDEIERTRI